MKTTKYEIELPTVPDGWELVGFTTPNPGDMYLKDLGASLITESGWMQHE